jgi:hypothetical protein
MRLVKVESETIWPAQTDAMRSSIGNMAPKAPCDLRALGVMLNRKLIAYSPRSKSQLCASRPQPKEIHRAIIDRCRQRDRNSALITCVPSAAHGINPGFLRNVVTTQVVGCGSRNPQVGDQA